LFFALVPSIVLTAAWATSWSVLPLTSTATAWDSAAVTGARALAVARERHLSRADAAIVRQHEEALSESLKKAKMAGLLLRRAALEAERLSALRETARQVAHELKNPLTPIRFAVERLRREAPPSMQESVDVLAAESARLEELARSFAQFGRLPEGPRAPVDL